MINITKKKLVKIGQKNKFSILPRRVDERGQSMFPHLEGLEVSSKREKWKKKYAPSYYQPSIIFVSRRTVSSLVRLFGYSQHLLPNQSVKRNQIINK